MRFNKPLFGERRQVSGFLWWPKTIGRQTRWLERASWVEEFQSFKCNEGWGAIAWESP